MSGGGFAIVDKRNDCLKFGDYLERWKTVEFVTVVPVLVAFQQGFAEAADDDDDGS